MMGIQLDGTPDASHYIVTFCWLFETFRNLNISYKDTFVSRGATVYVFLYSCMRNI